MRRPLLLAGLTAVSCVGIGLAMWMKEAPPAPVEPPTSADEQAALTASKGLAWRDAKGLSVRLKTGEVLTLAERSQCGDVACPKDISVRYRYLGWDEAHGGYHLSLEGGSALAPTDVILPFADDPAMVDARHAESVGKNGMPLPSVPGAAKPDDDLGEWLADISDARAKDEAPRLAKAKGKVQREGGQLILTLDGGKKMVFADDLSCGQVVCPSMVFRNYDYVGASPDGRYQVVGEHWDEANAAMLVAVKDGAVTPLLGRPSFSPDGKRAVSTVTELEWSAPRRLEVWNLTGETPTLEFSVAAREGDDTIYEPLSWKDADHLRLSKGSWGQDDAVGTEVTLTHRPDGWRIDGGN